MANPYRGIANARRVNNSDYMVFGRNESVAREAFEKALRYAGYTNIRVTRFRSGSNDRYDFGIRVSVYWKDGQPAPNMDAFFNEAKQHERNL